LIAIVFASAECAAGSVRAPAARLRGGRYDPAMRSPHPAWNPIATRPQLPHAHPPRRFHHLREHIVQRP